MKIHLFLFSLLLCLPATLTRANDVKTLECGTEDYGIEVKVSFANDNVQSMAWTISRSGEEQLNFQKSTKGESLWPFLGASSYTEWPIGIYVAESDPGQNVLLNVSRPASVGGGGYSHEGTLTVVSNEILHSWGILCVGWQ